LKYLEKKHLFLIEVCLSIFDLQYGSFGKMEFDFEKKIRIELKEN